MLDKVVKIICVLASIMQVVVFVTFMMLAVICIYSQHGLVLIRANV